MERKHRVPKSVSKPVSETEPLLDKRVIKEKVKETVLFKHFVLTSSCTLGPHEFPD